MNKIIKKLTLVTFLAMLAACGGSDGDVTGGSASTDTTEEEAEEREETEPDPVEEIEVANLGLGSGVGTAYSNGEIQTSLSVNETLSANGTTSVTVDIVDLSDANAHYLGVQQVFFRSTCSQLGLAEFSPEEMEASATATSTYKDKGCGKEAGATDNVVVYIGEASDDSSIDVIATARGSIDVEAAIIGAVQFITVTDSTIALDGFGTETSPALSEIEFQVIDESGNPMPDRTVRFVLDHELGGASLSLTTAITDQDGRVKTMLNSGNVSGVVRIKALVDVKDIDGAVLKTISTLSTPVTMATSLADQNSSSIALSSYNAPAWNVNGETVSVTVHLGDHYQNPVIDGTSVYFRATGGIVESSCVTSNGACSVNWISANPRPVDGLVTIVAYTRGAGNYQDSNSNGLFDLKESFESFGESYIDANGDGIYSTTGTYQPDVDLDGDGTADFLWADSAYLVTVDNSGTYEAGSSNFYEEFIDSNNNNSIDETPSGKYQGVNCTDAAIEEGHCAEQVDIVLSTRLQMSTSNDAYIEGPFAWDSTEKKFDTSTELECVDASSASQLIGWRISDSKARRNNLAMESSIGFDTVDVDVVTSTGGGAVLSNYPVDTYSVWLDNHGAVKGPDAKYDYLAERGHIVAANILRPETFTTVTGIGSISAEVKTTSSESILSSSLNVDLLGPQLTLASKEVGVIDLNTIIDIQGGAQSFTVVVRNACDAGLAEGTLVITTQNGTLSNAAYNASGNATGVSIDPVTNIFEAPISNESKPTVVTFTLNPDASSDPVTDSLNITLRVTDPVFDIDDYIVIGQFDVQD